MKIRKLFLPGLLLGTVVMTSPAVWAKDKPVNFQECPPAVQAVLQQYSAQGKLEEIGLDEKKKSGGPAVYEAKFTMADGKRIEVHIATDGQVITVENKKPKKN